MAINPYRVRPLGGANVGQSVMDLGRLFMLRAQGQAQQQQREAEQQRRQAMNTAVMSAYRANDPDQVAAVMAQYPEAQRALESAINFRSDATKRNMLQSARAILANPENTEEILRARGGFVRANGGQPADYDAEARAYRENPEAYLAQVRNVYAGLAPPQEYEAYKQSAGMGATQQQKVYEPQQTASGEWGFPVYDPNTGKTDFKIVPGLTSKSEADKMAARLRERQSIADIGVEAESRKAQERARIRRETEPKIAARVEGVKIGTKKAAELADRLPAIRSTIAAYDEVIDLIDSGAKTGPIMDRLPSITSSARKLENIKRRLGLDIISEGSFGPLSEAEMYLAMDTALPTGLSGPDLREWVIQRRDAQIKLADELRNAAIFLGAGNTVSDWIEEQQRRNPTAQQPAAQQNLPPQNEQGWRLMVDANNNRAYVGPNGQIQEVP